MFRLFWARPCQCRYEDSKEQLKKLNLKIDCMIKTKKAQNNKKGDKKCL